MVKVVRKSVMFKTHTNKIGEYKTYVGGDMVEDVVLTVGLYVPNGKVDEQEPLSVHPAIAPGLISQLVSTKAPSYKICIK